MKSRPIGVTILAALAALATVYAGVRVLQFIGLIPFFGGPFDFRVTNWWYALMWALMVWVYAWLTRSLWRVEPGAWLFLVVIASFNLILEFMVMLTGGAMTDSTVPVLLNVVILVYCMLPGVKGAFGTAAPQA